MASQITVTFTTFDRYLAICQHHSCFAVMTRRTTLLLILVAWLVAFVIAFCPLVGAHRWGTITSCKYNQLFPPAVYFSVATTVLGFGVLAFAMYIFILRKASAFHRRVQSNREHVTEDTGKKNSMARDVRSAKVMGFVTIAFTFCWAPYTLYQYQYVFGISHNNANDRSVSNWLVFLGMFNSVINPFIYAWQRQDFRIACRKMFKCCS